MAGRVYNRDLTPAQIAANRLDKIVKEFPSQYTPLLKQWRNTVLHMENVRSLSMDDLAVTLRLLEDERVAGRQFQLTTEVLKPYLQNILSKVSTVESEEIRITKHAVNIFAYKTKIAKYEMKMGQYTEIPMMATSYSELPMEKPITDAEGDAQLLGVDENNQDEVVESDDDYVDD